MAEGGYASFSVGQEASFRHKVTADDVETFAQLSGDRNQLHMDDASAKAKGFEGRLVHGLLASSLFSRLVGMHLPGKDALYLSQDLHFRRPIMIGQELVVKGTITKKMDLFKVLTLQTTIMDAEGMVCISGTAKVKVLGGGKYVFDDVTKEYPLFARTAAYLEKQSYFYRPNLVKIKEMGMDLPFAERWCEHCWNDVGKDEKAYFKQVHALIDFSLEFLRLQLILKRTGTYLYKSYAEVEENVYNDPTRKLTGPWYMWALYFSQIFWITHWNVLKFFHRAFIPQKGTGAVLEVPTGTGIFLAEFLKKSDGWKGIGIDLSDSSIQFTKKVLDWSRVAERTHIIKGDLFDYQPKERFDRIMCGEFLEHVEDPVRVLKTLRSLVKPEGKVFLTVAVYASMIDHIYLYHSAEEVRVHIREAGFCVDEELVQAVFQKDKPEEKDVPLNYCAILSPAE
ncbi:MAG: MaoC/PaaZ C-terminal domain-containing protein [Nanoarchaeota archaeon]